jgi:hypothetical protein
LAILLVKLPSTLLSHQVLHDIFFSAANTGLENALQQWRVLLQNLTGGVELILRDLFVMCKKLIYSAAGNIETDA